MKPATLFKVLSDPTRLRLLVLLAARGPLCVCELTAVLRDAQPKTSRHLGEMRKAGLLSDHKQGLWVFYHLSPDLPPAISRIIDTTVEQLQHQSPHAEDLGRLRLVAGDTERCQVPGSRPATA